MSEIMLKTNERVKTLSIIDTISELAQNENEASRLTLPSPISNNQNNSGGKSPRKYSSSNNISGKILIGQVQNGINVPKYQGNNTPSPRKTNDKNGHQSLPPPLISPSLQGSKSSPRSPHFSLYEIDQQQQVLGFIASTPTSPSSSLSNKSKGILLSPFSGGARPKVGSLRINKGPSRVQESDGVPGQNQYNAKDFIRLNTSAINNNTINSNEQTQSSSNQKAYPIKKSPGSQFFSQSVSFGAKQLQPFVTLDSSGCKLETQNGKVQTPDWIRDIFLHAKRGNREKLVC